MLEIDFSNHRLKQIEKNVLEISSANRVYEYRSEFAERLLHAIALQKQGLLCISESHYCDCYSMTAYLTGHEDGFRWPDPKEDLFDPGSIRRIENDMRLAIAEFQFPIAMVSNRQHSATLLSGTNEADCLVAQKKGSRDFEFCSYNDFISYFRGTATEVHFFEHRKKH